MKYLFLTFLILISVTGYSRIVEEYNDDGEIIKVIPYKGNVKHGIEKWFFSNGDIHRIMPYRNGFLHGTVKVYFENGKLRRVTKYVNGSREGKEVVYFDDGSFRRETHFKHNVRNGFEKGWDYPFNGGDITVFYEAYYKDGVLNGIYKEYFNGEISLKVNLKNGKKHGIEISYGVTGRSETKYINGKQVGKTKSYDKKGNLEKEEDD